MVGPALRDTQPAIARSQPTPRPHQSGRRSRPRRSAETTHDETTSLDLHRGRLGHRMGQSGNRGAQHLDGFVFGSAVHPFRQSGRANAVDHAGTRHLDRDCNGAETVFDLVPASRVSARANPRVLAFDGVAGSECLIGEFLERQTQRVVA